jgi:peptidoglycan lytic transglycosylase
MRDVFAIFLITLFIHLNLAKATFYGPGFEGRRMADGAVFHQRDMVAASNYWPLETKLRVTNLLTGESVSVTVKDRTDKRYRVLDLSSAAFDALGISRRNGWAIVTMTEDPLEKSGG